MFSFQEYGAYKKAKELNVKIHSILRNKSIPLYSRDQLQRASLSIMLNIAEGSGRETLPDRNRFFSMAKGSVMECVAIIDILKDLKMIGLTQYNDVADPASEIIRILYATIKRTSSQQ